ncbi:hypothetical protein [Amycolatopsis sp. NPDC051061]|uniref:hypothetical protein n=1 Tax=Amycolatopsis sp. NPDC051061 TaxID=3155042 RepID=UPI003417150A
MTTALAAKLGVAPTARAFAEVGDADLVQVRAELHVDTRYGRSLGVSPFKPVVDGTPRLAPIDLVIGTIENAADLYIAEPVTDADVFAAAIRRHPAPEWLAARFRARFAARPTSGPRW